MNLRRICEMEAPGVEQPGSAGDSQMSREKPGSFSTGPVISAVLAAGLLAGLAGCVPTKNFPVETYRTGDGRLEMTPTQYGAEPMCIPCEKERQQEIFE